MPGKYFLDTNILVYTFDNAAPAKKKKASALMSTALAKNNGVISYQVVQEFLNVATQKFSTPFSYHEAALYLDQVLMPLCELHSSIELYQTALDIKKQFRYSFYDALIITSALKSHCNTLYSEDLHDGQVIKGLTIKNPF